MQYLYAVPTQSNTQYLRSTYAVPSSIIVLLAQYLFMYVCAVPRRYRPSAKRKRKGDPYGAIVSWSKRKEKMKSVLFTVVVVVLRILIRGRDSLVFGRKSLGP